jgi:8-oxo-dGTP diphosphatase
LSEFREVTAAIIERNGRYLICQRRRDDVFPLRWEFPGGKVEPGENKTQAIVRELKEELGIDAVVGPEVFQTCHRYPGGFNVDLTVFRIDSFEGDPRNLAFEAICWVKPDRLDSFDFLAADRALVRWLGDREGDSAAERGARPRREEESAAAED